MNAAPDPSRLIAILLPDLRGGGAERVNVNLANAFVARGFRVQVVLMRMSGELAPLLDPRVGRVDLRAARVRGVLRPLMRYLRDARPDALLANMWPLTVIAVLARRLTRAPTRIVAVEHTTWSSATLMRRRSTRVLAKTTMRALLPRADAVLGVSRGVADDLARFARLEAGSVGTIYNPVVRGTRDAPPPLPPDGAERWSRASCKRVLAVGSLKAPKNFPLLLRAFARLRDRLDARLLILGEGTQRAELEALAASLGLRDAVDMPGFVDNTAAYYAHADLFVLSSRHEGLPTVLIEALEQGTPVVSTDCPSGPREILEGGRYGRLVPVDDTEALAAAMLESLRSTHDREALRARAQDFAVDRIADRYLEVLLPGRGSEVPPA